MKLSIRDLIISGLFIIIASTVVSNLYRPKWGIIYAVVNLIVLTLFSLFKDSWSIKKKLVEKLLLLMSKEIG